MVNGLIGKKVGMTQIFGADGRMIPVTVVEAGPCRVVVKKTLEKDGYNAVQISFRDAKEKHLTKPVLGHFKKNGVSPARYLAEFTAGDAASLTAGQELTVEIFKEGELIDISGLTKGKGKDFRG